MRLLCAFLAALLAPSRSGTDGGMPMYFEQQLEAGSLDQIKGDGPVRVDVPAARDKNEKVRHLAVYVAMGAPSHKGQSSKEREVPPVCDRSRFSVAYSECRSDVGAWLARSTRMCYDSQYYFLFRTRKASVDNVKTQKQANV